MPETPNLPEYWTEADRLEAEACLTFEDLSFIAQRIAARMPRPLAIICGPITTGGLGSVEKNLARFAMMIDRVKSSGENVFYQLQFEPYLWKIIGSPNDRGGFHLLEAFYQPLFTLYIQTFYFIPGWESSSGACWERAVAIMLKREIKNLREYEG
jgi:hypothetical protein